MSPLTITFLPCNFLAMNTLRGFIAIAPTPQFDLAPARLCVSVGLARVSDGRAILCYWVYSGGGENPSFHSFFFIVAQGDDGLHSAHWWTSYHSQAPRLSEPWTVCCTFHSLPGCAQGLMRCMLGDDEPCTLRIIAWVTSILAQRAIRYRLMISFAVTSINVPEIHQQQFEYQCKLSWMGQDFWFYCSNLSVEIYSRICGSKKTLKENHITSKAANPIVIETSTGRVALTRRHRMEGW